MKLSKLFKGILCASLLMGGMAIMPNKTNAVEIEPYAIVREIKVNRREKADVQLPGLDKQFVYVDFSGSYILATNPNGIQNWQVSVSLPDGVSRKSNGSIGYYKVTLQDYDYSYRTGGAKVTLYLKVQYTHNSEQSDQIIKIVNI